MGKKLGWIISLVVLLVLIGVYVYFNNSGSITGNAIFSQGDGSVENPYLIYTAEQLNAIGASKSYWDKNFKLMDNISLSSYNNFNKIGLNSLNPADGRNYFTGHFDGNNYVISDLVMDKPDEDFLGLFGYVDGGTIRNTHLVNVSISGSDSVGGLVGFLARGNITNSTFSGQVSGESLVGGLVGRLAGATANPNAYIKNSKSFGIVNGTSYVGGLVGLATSSFIDNSYSNISVFGTSNISGLVGYYTVLTINNSYAISNLGFACNNEEYFVNQISQNANCSLKNHNLIFYYSNLSFLESNLSFLESNLSFLESNLILNISNMIMNLSKIKNSNFILQSDNSTIYLQSDNSTIYLQSDNSTIEYILTDTIIIFFREKMGEIMFFDKITSEGENLEEVYNLNFYSEFNSTANVSTLFEGMASIALVNSTLDPNFNKSANITFDLTGWKIHNSTILRNEVVCNSTTSPACFNLTPLIGGLIKFNVSSWSTYEINGTFERTCGNNLKEIEYNEVCDGSDFGGLNCASYGNFNTGSLSCSVTCDAISYTGCSYVAPNTGSSSSSSGGGGGGGGGGSSNPKNNMTTNLFNESINNNQSSPDIKVIGSSQDSADKINSLLSKGIVLSVIIAVMILVVVVLAIYFILRLKKNSLQSFSISKKQEIELLLKKGYEFVNKKDFVNAKKTYGELKEKYESLNQEQKTQELFDKIKDYYGVVSKI